MSLTYLEMKCLMEDNQDPPPEGGLMMDSGEESRATKVVRVGMNLREDEDDTSFWQDFISLCSDAEGMAELFDVKATEVKRWSSKIREAIEKVKETNSKNPEGEDDKKVVPTGDNDGALSTDDQGFAGI